MRICIFARGMGGHRPGGYVWPFEILARDMAARGHAVTVLTTARGAEGAATPPAEGFDVRYLPDTTPEKVDARFWAASAAAFDALHPRIGFDVALGRGASSWGLLSRSRFAGALPLVSHQGTYPPWLHRAELARRPGHRLLSRLRAVREARRGPETARCLMRSARVVCVAPSLERAVRRMLWWRTPHTTTIPYGFDLAQFVPSGATARTGAGPMIAYVGRLTPAKGAEALIDILARLGRSDATLEAIGPVEPAYRERLLALAERRGVAGRLRLAGPLPHASLADRLGAADAFLFPSMHPEGLSKAVMEAMAVGLPVVAYALPGFDGLIADGVDGCLVPPRRNDLAAARLDALLRDPETAARIGGAARRRIATDFAPERAARAWDELLEAVARDHAARPARGDG